MQRRGYVSGRQTQSAIHWRHASKWRIGMALAMGGGLTLLPAKALAERCESHLFPADVESIMLAKVIAPTAQLFTDKACASPSGMCRTKGYLVRDDRLLRSGLVRDGRACIAFVDRRDRQTVAWIAERDIILDRATQPLADWSGRWKRSSGGAVLTIVRQARNAYIADALATYAVSSENVRTAAATGPLRFHIDHGGTTIASFGEDGEDRSIACRVRLRQLDRWLLADDGATENSNSACGGMGVTLSGIYHRSSPAR